MNYNKVIIGGNLTREPEVRYTSKGTAVGDLSVAINESVKSQDGTVKEHVTYVNVTVWGRQAETCKEHLTKGRPVFIEGRLKLETWEQDGQKRSRLGVVADRVHFIGNKANVPKKNTEEPVGDDGIPPF